MVNLKHVCPMFDRLDSTGKAKFSKIYHFFNEKKGKHKLSFITSLLYITLSKTYQGKSNSTRVRHFLTV